MSRALLVIDVQNEYFTGALPITHPAGHLEQILKVMDAAAGRIPTVVAGPDVRPRAVMRRPLDHYGILRSLETAFGLPRLGAARSARHGSLAPLFRAGRLPSL